MVLTMNAVTRRRKPVSTRGIKVLTMDTVTRKRMVVSTRNMMAVPRTL